jgi:ABC-type dipeptide/oligopeptide/nickel transport system permease subunit
MKCADKSGKVSQTFSYMGSHSIEIYLIHFFFAFKFPELGKYLLGLEFYGTSLFIQIMYSIVVSTIIIALCLSVAKIISHSKILSFFLLGKSKVFLICLT